MAEAHKVPQKRMAAHTPPKAAPDTTLGPAKFGAPSSPTRPFNPGLFLTKLVSGRTSRVYRDKEAVFAQGDPADAVFYIESGKVTLTAVSKQGKEVIVAILPEKSFLGEGCRLANRFACLPR